MNNSGDSESPTQEQQQCDDNASAEETSQSDVRLEIEIEERGSLPDGIVSMNSRETELLLRHRSPHIIPTGEASKHRQEMQRILLDSAANVRYDVPDSKQRQNSNPQPRKQKLEYLRWKNILPIPFASCGSRKEYSWSSFQSDIIAGITVAVMAIPLGMSYAELAGLPPFYGLYASFVPPLVYPLFGTSRHLGVGPAALVSLLVSAGVTPIVQSEGLEDPTSEDYIRRYTSLAIQSSFMAGLVTISMGLFRLGFVTQFLSRALISGFTSGAAVVIAASQLKHLFGYKIPSSSLLYEIIENLAKGIDQFNWKPFLMGSTTIVILSSLKKLNQNESFRRKYPIIKWIRALSSILVSAVAILLVYFLDLEQKGIRTVGSIPSGLPAITIQYWTPISSELWLVVISMVIVGFAQAISISKRLAYKHGYEIDPSQELISLGIACLVGGMFQSYPTTGCLGQSAVNDEVGAKTGVSSVVTGLFVMIVLLFLTPVFEKMPLAVLAAIVISYVLSMFDYTEAIYLYKVHKFDFAVWIVAFLSTMFLGVEFGIGVAVGVSILIVIYESVYPHTAVLGRLPGTSLYRNIKQYSNAERYDGLLIIRIDGPIYFANAVGVRDKIRKYKKRAVEELAQRNAGQVMYIILDLSPVSHIDTTALHVLEDMYLTQKNLGVKLCFCNPGIKVSEQFVKCGLVELIGRKHFFSSVVDAVQWCLNEMDSHVENLETAAGDIPVHVVGHF